MFVFLARQARCQPGAAAFTKCLIDKVFRQLHRPKGCSVALRRLSQVLLLAASASLTAFTVREVASASLSLRSATSRPPAVYCLCEPADRSGFGLSWFLHPTHDAPLQGKKPRQPLCSSLRCTTLLHSHPSQLVPRCFTVWHLRSTRRRLAGVIYS